MATPSPNPGLEPESDPNCCRFCKTPQRTFPTIILRASVWFWLQNFDPHLTEGERVSEIRHICPACMGYLSRTNRRYVELHGNDVPGFKEAREREQGAPLLDQAEGGVPASTPRTPKDQGAFRGQAKGRIFGWEPWTPEHPDIFRGEPLLDKSEGGVQPWTIWNTALQDIIRGTPFLDQAEGGIPTCTPQPEESVKVPVSAQNSPRRGHPVPPQSMTSNSGAVSSSKADIIEGMGNVTMEDRRQRHPESTAGVPLSLEKCPRSPRREHPVPPQSMTSNSGAVSSSKADMIEGMENLTMEDRRQRHPESTAGVPLSREKCPRSPRREHPVPPQSMTSNSGAVSSSKADIIEGIENLTMENRRQRHPESTAGIPLSREKCPRSPRRGHPVPPQSMTSNSGAHSSSKADMIEDMENVTMEDRRQRHPESTAGVPLSREKCPRSPRREHPVPPQSMTSNSGAVSSSKADMIEGMENLTMEDRRQRHPESTAGVPLSREKCPRSPRREHPVPPQSMTSNSGAVSSSKADIIEGMENLTMENRRQRHPESTAGIPLSREKCPRSPRRGHPVPPQSMTSNSGALSSSKADMIEDMENLTMEDRRQRHPESTAGVPLSREKCPRSPRREHPVPPQSMTSNSGAVSSSKADMIEDMENLTMEDRRQRHPESTAGVPLSREKCPRSPRREHPVPPQSMTSNSGAVSSSKADMIEGMENLTMEDRRQRHPESTAGVPLSREKCPRSPRREHPVPPQSMTSNSGAVSSSKADMIEGMENLTMEDRRQRHPESTAGVPLSREKCPRSPRREHPVPPQSMTSNSGAVSSSKADIIEGMENLTMENRRQRHPESTAGIPLSREKCPRSPRRGHPVPPQSMTSNSGALSSSKADMIEGMENLTMEDRRQRHPESTAGVPLSREKCPRSPRREHPVPPQSMTSNSGAVSSSKADIIEGMENLTMEDRRQRHPESTAGVPLSREKCPRSPRREHPVPPQSMTSNSGAVSSSKADMIEGMENLTMEDRRQRHPESTAGVPLSLEKCPRSPRREHPDPPQSMTSNSGAVSSSKVDIIEGMENLTMEDRRQRHPESTAGVPLSREKCPRSPRREHPVPPQSMTSNSGAVSSSKADMIEGMENLTMEDRRQRHPESTSGVPLSREKCPRSVESASAQECRYPVRATDKNVSRINDVNWKPFRGVTDRKWRTGEQARSWSRASYGNPKRNYGNSRSGRRNKGRGGYSSGAATKAEAPKPSNEHDPRMSRTKDRYAYKGQVCKSESSRRSKTQNSLAYWNRKRIQQHNTEQKERNAKSKKKEEEEDAN